MSNQPQPQIDLAQTQTVKIDRTFLKPILWLCIFAVALVAGAYFAFQDARRGLLKMGNVPTMRQIAIALLEYEKTYKSFPPPYTVDAAGNKLHSWRTLLLPYLSERSRYNAIDFSKPWDAPENARPRSVRLDVFNAPLAEIERNETVFHVIVHPGGVFSDPAHLTKLSDIQAPANTILVVQAGNDQATHWMEPDEYSLADFLAITSANSVYARGGTHVVNCDTSVPELHVQDFTPQQIEEMILINKSAPMPQP